MLNENTHLLISSRWLAIDSSSVVVFFFLSPSSCAPCRNDSLFIAQIVLIFIFHVPWAAPWKHTATHNSWSFIGECGFYRSNLFLLSMSGGLWYEIYSSRRRKKQNTKLQTISSYARRLSIFLKLEPFVWKMLDNSLTIQRLCSFLQSILINL